MLIALALLAQTVPPADHPGEEAVAPYAARDANAGATPFAGTAMLRAFHGHAGIARIVDTLVTRAQADHRIADIFKGQDMVRLRRTLVEQFCYILNGGCAYTGRDMRAAHKDMGLQGKDMNALVEDLQVAMTRERVPFARQNAFLAKLAPMRGDVLAK